MAECHIYPCGNEATHVKLFHPGDAGKIPSQPRFAYRCDLHAEKERDRVEDSRHRLVSLEEAKGEPANLWRWTIWEGEDD